MDNHKIQKNFWNIEKLWLEFNCILRGSLPKCLIVKSKVVSVDFNDWKISSELLPRTFVLTMVGEADILRVSAHVLCLLLYHLSCPMSYVLYYLCTIFCWHFSGNLEGTCMSYTHCCDVTQVLFRKCQVFIPNIVMYGEHVFPCLKHKSCPCFSNSPKCTL